MKKTLLILSVCATMFTSFMAKAQDETPYTLTVYDQAIFYGMYEGTVNEPIPEGAIRNSNSSYGKKLTQAQLDAFGNTLTMTVTLNPLCDNYDRIGNVNIAFVPKNSATYVYNEVKRIEIGRFITPFMNKNSTIVTEVPYVYDLDHLTNIFHDEAITSLYDFWVELEVYAYQGDSTGGAVAQIAGCVGHNDVYMGTLTFESDTDSSITPPASSFIGPMSYKYELKNYTWEGTDVLDQTVRSIDFILDNPIENAQLHIITSNHGSNNNGEEYNRREHFIYFDNVEKLQYIPGGKSCEPYRQYNTQGNGIYGSGPKTLNYWLSFNNWCPGDVIPNRVIDLGTVAAGQHTYRIEVPDAVFPADQGYFPMSVYLTGDGASTITLGLENFGQKAILIYPNPVNDVVTIAGQDINIKAVSIVNTLGQTVYNGTSDKVDMSQLQSGIYMVKVVLDNNQTTVKKIVKN